MSTTTRGVLLLVFLVVSCVGFSSGFASDDLVPTPGGYRDGAFVYEIEPGQQIRVASDRYEITDGRGSIVRSIPKREVQSQQVHADGWVTYTSWTNDTGSSIKSFVSTWKVPQTPPSSGGQLLYLFNGMEPDARDAILQPVLQWGTSPAGGGNYWAVASWYVTSDGQAMHSKVTPVNPGDTLLGVMKLTSSGHATDAGTFSYTSEFTGIANSSVTVSNISELTWASETLETYGTAQCSDYPAAPTAFTQIGLQTDVVPDSLNWEVANAITDCGQHASVTSPSAVQGEVDIFYAGGPMNHEGHP